MDASTVQQLYHYNLNSQLEKMKGKIFLLEFRIALILIPMQSMAIDFNGSRIFKNPPKIVFIYRLLIFQYRYTLQGKGSVVEKESHKGSKGEKQETSYWTGGGNQVRYLPQTDILQKKKKSQKSVY